MYLVLRDANGLQLQQWPLDDAKQAFAVWQSKNDKKYHLVFEQADKKKTDFAQAPSKECADAKA